MIEFKKVFSLKNSKKLNKKNWHKVVAVSSKPCTGIHGVKAIDQAKEEHGAYFEKWKLAYEDKSDDHAGGYIFREINHGCGINGRHKTYREAIFWAAGASGHIKVYLEE